MPGAPTIKWFLLVGLLVLLAALLWPESEAPQTGTADTAGSRPRGVVPVDDATNADGARPTAPEALPEDEPALVERYLAINRYPARNRRLTEHSHDLLNPGARHERRQPLPTETDGAGPQWQVLLTADRYFIHGDEDAWITLRLWQDDHAVAPGRPRMVARAIEAQQTLDLDVDFREAEARARFDPDDAWPDYAGPVRVVAEFMVPGQGVREGALDFYFTGSNRIPARFSGAVGDRLDDGDLVFDIGLTVRRPGRYRIEANLSDQWERPFGWARFEGQLQPGPQTVELRYDGLLFHDARAQGPYLLTRLRGHRSDPGRLDGRQSIPPVELAHLTDANYSLEDFRTTVRLGPRELHMLNLYEDAVRRGVQLSEPRIPENETLQEAAATGRNHHDAN